jgi:class 3 adenylate cyclase
MMTCAGCGEENPARARFCLGCGTPLHAPAGQGKARKTVTVLFCDVVGSTDLGARLDPEPLGRVMARWFDRARQVFERHEGTMAKFIGDAVMAVFGVPSVREDDAVRAVRAPESSARRWTTSTPNSPATGASPFRSAPASTPAR